MGDRTSVEKIPRFAIGVDGPAADDPRVKEIEALVARPVDLPVWLADQHGLALMDGDLMRTDLNLEWHRIFRFALERARGSRATATINSMASAAPAGAPYRP